MSSEEADLIDPAAIVIVPAMKIIDVTRKRGVTGICPLVDTFDRCRRIETNHCL